MSAEIVCSGTLSQEELVMILTQCTFLQEGGTFLGESLPFHIVASDQRGNLVQCIAFTTEMTYKAYAQYTFGRIFHPDFELRWQYNAQQIQATYIGIEHEIPFLHRVEDLKIEKGLVQQYYLFGERVSGDQEEKVGKVVGNDSFAEARIPRLLHYPVKKGRYVQLVMQEYIDTQTKQVALQRFVKLRGHNESL